MGARGPKAVVEPVVLKWLRTSSGLTVEETARKLNTKSDNLTAWEAGEAQPSMSQLRRLAKAFKRPISYFYLPQPIEEPSIPHDFRRLPDAGDRRYSSALLHEIRMANRRRTFARDLASDLGTPLARFDGHGTVSVEEDPEAVAQRMRQMVRVETDHQKTWGDSRAAYRAWRRMIENLGVLVFQVTGVDLNQVLGFSLAHTELPVIAINRKLAPNGRTFTMLHEFTHLLLGASGVCDIDESLPRGPQEQRTEIYCNHVAGAALVPRNALLAHPLVESARPKMRDWEDTTLVALAREFGASEEVVARRLLINGRTSTAFYARKRAAYQSRFADRAGEDRANRDFRRNVPQEAVSNLSSFARLVLDGYHADMLSLAEASRHLGVRAEKVAAVDNLMR